MAHRAWNAFDGLAGDTLWSGGLDLLAVVTAMLSFILLQDVLDVPEYGAYTGLYALASTFSAITYSGPGLALVQRRFRFKQDLNEIQASFLSLALIAGLVATSVSFVLALLIINLSPLEIALITASELFANSIIWVVGWLVQIASDFPAMIRVRMGAVLLKLLTVPALYWTGQLTIRNLGLCYLLLYGAFAGWLVFAHLPKLGYDVRFRRPKVDVWRSSGVFAVPLAASQLQSEGDKIALNAFNMDTDAGLYGAAYRVVGLGALPVRVIGQAAFHRFLDEGDVAVEGYHLRRAARLTAFMFAVGVATAGAIYFVLYLMTPVIDLIIKEKFAEAKEIIPWLVLFIPLLAVSGTPLNGLLGLGRTRQRAVVYTTSAIISLVLYSVLIPRWGWQGAVGATLLSELYLAVVSWAVMVHYQRVADRARIARDPAVR